MIDSVKSKSGFGLIISFLLIFSFVSYLDAKKPGSSLDVFVSPTIKNTVYEKIAVLPFKAPTELAGSSISDFFTNEILKTYKYQLIERSQIENIFKEQEMNLSGVTESSVAIEVGKILGVNATVIGTVSEYGYQQYKATKLPSVGLTVRLIDTTTGKIVWSASDTQVAASTRLSLSQHANNMVENMVSAIMAACKDMGDNKATALPVPVISSYTGGVRSAAITVNKISSDLISSYEILRSVVDEQQGYKTVSVESNSKKLIVFQDKNLLDSTLYFYKVRTVSRNGLVGNESKPVQIITEGPPPTPRKVKAESEMLRQIPLSWEPPDYPYLSGYIIYRKNGSSAFGEIAVIKNPKTADYLDKESRKNPIADDTEYTYQICSFNTAGVKSPPSKEFSAVTLALPVKIENLVCQSGLVKSVSLSWDISPEPQTAGYNIYRYDPKKKEFAQLTILKGRDTTSYVDQKEGFSSLKDGTTYQYRVAAYYRKDAEGVLSDPQEATTKPVPHKVSGFTASSGEVKQITLTWDQNPEDDITYYLIFRGNKENRLSKIAIVPAEQLTYTDRDLKDGTQYFYAAAAQDKDELLGDQSVGMQGSTKPIPKTVQGLSATISGISEIVLSWVRNPEADISCYEIHENKSLLGKTGDTSWVYTDGKPGESYHFYLTAVDEDQLRSEPCKKIIVKIPKL
ncbi:MAG: DUF799 family lipoprotein [Candidatus Aureabacteria bacterium]|nr:DUF799 family lipoprotein [Candidatus Auribacterota bacterium]